jgi:hypothetical protein
MERFQLAGGFPRQVISCHPPEGFVVELAELADRSCQLRRQILRLGSGCFHDCQKLRLQATTSALRAFFEAIIEGAGKMKGYGLSWHLVLLTRSIPHRPPWTTPAADAAAIRSRHVRAGPHPP